MPVCQETNPRPFHDVLKVKRAAFEILRWLMDLLKRWRQPCNEMGTLEAMDVFLRDYASASATVKMESSGHGDATGIGSSSSSSSSSGGSSMLVPAPVSSPSDICWDEIYLDPFTFSDRFEDLSKPPPPVVTTTPLSCPIYYASINSLKLTTCHVNLLPLFVPVKYKGSGSFSRAQAKAEVVQGGSEEARDATMTTEDGDEDDSGPDTDDGNKDVDDVDGDSWITSLSQRRRYRRDLKALASLERTLQVTDWLPSTPCFVLSPY